jgi:hypothetical protein
MSEAYDQRVAHSFRKRAQYKGVGSCVFRSWWVFLFCFLCISSYVQASRSRDSALTDLALRYCEMEQAKMAALREQEELSMRMHSEHDPAWIELVLMRELGVVPEGWIKVHFTK